MRFKTGDKVEFIWSGKLKQGVVTEIEETKNAIYYQIKYSGDMGMTWLDERDLIAPAPVLNVPRFADDWIKHCKQREYDLACLLDYEDSDMSAEMNDWLCLEESNQWLLARAWMDGYEVEKEPLYYVQLVNKITGYLNVRSGGYLFLSTIHQNRTIKTKFTEAEIKAMDKGEAYWLLRKPVEEAEGEA
ncbi:DUF1642 domain-containing protein [Listeria monocytogenes]|uniref:DUF1642 domain-containing protein n=1 Tax=Listeria monocytogenes TaxID=1639 RepID=UPI000D176EC3|nr:DUF1642 domain-containing protein [Listeria monocytogenes]AVS33423.1 hypothetical protein C9378_01455 [Listeria monocytogenes]EAA0112748.1 DUF1642 domain-containing protein [Listeria monocytogenes]EAA0358287.1 DUF1642 domain-containing protein [Listeria monocytogenes]EAC3002750.1 DUF1642 domain-containing protein [Listeria monocytogenes]EAC5964013.1 DUF1642 domain-containing protein [Listeria monocytogenes]